METFWTIQHIDKWKEFERTGVLQADERYIEPTFFKAYEWIRHQMHKRICAPLDPICQYPVWAWYKYDLKSYRPDLRRTGHFPKGETAVLIEFQEQMDKVVLSDFMDWHLVLNTPVPSPKDLKRWQSIIIDGNDKKRISRSIVQATLWTVSLQNVKSVKEFGGRG